MMTDTPVDLTPEVLARWEAVDEQTREAAALYLWDEGIVRPEHLARQVINALVDDGWRPSAPALLSGVRELTTELATVKQQRSDNLKAIAERDQRIAELEAVISESWLALEGESVAFGTSETNLYRSQRDAARRTLHPYRLGADQ